MASCASVLSPSRRRKPPLSGAFFPPSDLSDLVLLRALAVISAELISSGCRPPPLQRRNSSFLLRKIKVLSSFFEFLRDFPLDSSSFPASARLCFKELYILIHRCKLLVEYCAQGSRICVLMQNPQISGQFHDLVLEISTILDVLPIDGIDLSPDVREQLLLLRRQAGKSELFIDPCDESLRRKILSFLDEFSSGEVPDSEELRMVFVDRLGIRDVRDFRAEIEILEDQIHSQDEDDAGGDVSVVVGVAALLRYCLFLLFGFEENGKKKKDSDLDDERHSFKRSESNAASVVIPKDFCCPISLELMKDPVIMSTGQTYDRASITKWMDEGHSTCPNSGQTLVHTALVPNRALRRLISHWCADHDVTYESPENPDASAAPRASKAAVQANRATVGILIKRLACGPEFAKAIAARELRLLSKTGRENRAHIAEAGAIPLLRRLLCSDDAFAQENSVTAILNLSIHEANKARIMEEKGCLTSVVGVLKHGSTSEAKENAAATLFSLSAVHEYKKMIGDEPGAMEALAGLLRDGSARGKRDAVMALFNLSTHSQCGRRMQESGAVAALVEALAADVVAEDAAGALQLLVRMPELAQVVGRDEVAVKALVCLMRRGTARGKENAVAALYEMCRRGGQALVHEVARMPALGGAVQALMHTGTKRAKRKAASLVRMCQKSELAVAAAANGVEHALARSGSVRRVSSFSSGDVSVSVAVAMAVSVL